jgi:hypothetical protein
MHLPRILTVLVLSLLVVACTAVDPSSSGTPTTGPTPTGDATMPPKTPPPTREPQPTAAPTPAPTGLMLVTVLPVETPREARPAIPGERVCFLVMVDDRYIDDGEITFAATGDGVTIDRVPEQMPAPGEVAELWVTIDPMEGTDEEIATVELTVTHGGADPVDWVETRSIIVAPYTDDREEIAQPYVDFWVDWLAAEHPELGIDEATEWEPMYVSALWIVSKYAYWSDEWEMVVAWHEMVPPDDFTEVYLRRRDSETMYNLAFRQDSFSEGTTVHQLNPAELIR